MRLRRLRLDEIAEINRRRDADLARLAEGWEPTAEDLAGAPTISHWTEFTPVGSSRPALVGHVKNHPRALDGWAFTDEVLARGEGWVRTHHTFLRLGPEAKPRPHMQPREQEPAPVTVDDLSHLPDFGIR